MVPDGGAAEVDVKVSIRVLHAHDAVLLHLGLGVLQLGRAGPHVVHPAQLAGHQRRLQNLRQRT